MAYNDVVTAVANAIADAQTLENVINGAPNTQIKSRLGRYIWTLATIGYKIEVVNQQANAAINAIETNKTLTTQTANAAMFDINAARDNVQNLLDAKLNEMGNAIDSVAAVKSQENGWIATLVADASGMTQQQVNDKTALFYNTVADMVADTKLKAGKAVITHGYYAPNDGGGARYLIKDTPTDYSIPVANNLHAVFADTFDIRKFGIRDSATLDQTTEIQRMVNYADKFVYEIDFLNFSLMTPKITHFFTGRTTLVGMGFRKVHHLKNLMIANNKTEQLVQGVNPILFLPDDLNGRGKFKLSNVKFDPYVNNYKINNGEADGFMCGFVVEWHKDSNWVYPNSNWTVSNYDIELDDIEFLSPAISYNLACANIFTRNLIANNVRGDYWGIMLAHHTYNLDANNIHGVFRDDLHTGSGRLLVTNLIHEEAEIADGIITRNDIKISNSSCVKHTSGYENTIYKCHCIGSITVNNIEFASNKGSFEFYAGKTNEEKQRLTINKIEVTDMRYLICSLACVVNDAYFANIDVLDAKIIEYAAMIRNLTIDNIKSLKSALSIESGKCDNLIMSNIQSVDDVDYGIVRSNAQIKKIELTNVTCNQEKLIECAFETLIINKLTTNRSVGVNNFISWVLNTVFLPPTITINDSTVIAPAAAYTFLIYAANDGAKVYFNNVTLSDGNHGIYPYPIVNNSRITVTKTYDPPSLPSGSQQTTGITLLGAKAGDVLMCSFDKPLQGTRMWVETNGNSSATIYHRNDTGATVDLPSGTLTVKIV